MRRSTEPAFSLLLPFSLSWEASTSVRQATPTSVGRGGVLVLVTQAGTVSSRGGGGDPPAAAPSPTARGSCCLRKAPRAPRPLLASSFGHDSNSLFSSLELRGGGGGGQGSEGKVADSDALRCRGTVLIARPVVGR